MAVKQANIYHLYHSGVAVETDNFLLVFDYYNDNSDGQERNLANGVVTPAEFAEKEQGLVFVSHSHSDHFNPVIFDWQEKADNLKYILSEDVRVMGNKSNYYQLAKYQQLSLPEAVVTTYGTTDQGVSFLVEVDGLNIFHAGDLNWWHWNKFSPQERKKEEQDYKRELARLAGQDIDIACVPVDPRLDEHYYRGAQYFAEEIAPQLLVPIHFSDNYSITRRFVNEITDLSVEVAVVEQRGEKIEFKKE